VKYTIRSGFGIRDPGSGVRDPPVGGIEPHTRCEDTPVVAGRRGYHVPTGGHNLTPYDWTASRISRSSVKAVRRASQFAAREFASAAKALTFTDWRVTGQRINLCAPCDLSD
jgi:hypothetical protein